MLPVRFIPRSLPLTSLLGRHWRSWVLLRGAGLDDATRNPLRPPYSGFPNLLPFVFLLPMIGPPFASGRPGRLRMSYCPLLIDFSYTLLVVFVVTMVPCLLPIRMTLP